MKLLNKKYLTLSLLFFFLFSTSLNAQNKLVQVGKGSWYGKTFHGKRTANGEHYNMYECTAAHPTLPFNTIVRVTNLRNNRSINVRINDRGPYHGKRIIDLSYYAAKQLGYARKGFAKLKIKVLSKHSRHKRR